MTTHLVIPDSHAHPDHNNDRATWLAELIIDVKPDVVIHMGDSADLPSLSTYDKGKRSFHGRSYKKDIEAHLDFQDKLWSPIEKRKKRLPRRIFLLGNHEWRIEKALDLSPELTGTIGLNDLDLRRWYSDVVGYNGGTPGVINVNGIDYAHYFVSGGMGRPISSAHHGYALLAKRHCSSTAAHSHAADQYVSTVGGSRKIYGTVVGCYQDYTNDWAGESATNWWRGVVVKRNVENGAYDTQWISLDALRKEYVR